LYKKSYIYYLVINLKKQIIMSKRDELISKYANDLKEKCGVTAEWIY